MKLSFTNQVNAFGGFCVLIVGIFLSYDLSRSRDARPCSEHYAKVTELTLTRKGGVPLSSAELEARSGRDERGVLQKVTVVSRPDAKSPYVMNVAVGGPVASDSGASFFWTPSGLERPSAACLSYDFYLPAKFDFARGGRLPGLFGGNFNGLTDQQPNAFGFHLTWNERGQAGLEGATEPAPVSTNGDGPVTQTKPVDNLLNYRSDLEIPRGRWVHVEQEAILNQPGVANGVLRLWMDGTLKLEETALTWRPDDMASLSGVWEDVGYLSFGGTERAAKSLDNIQVSPPQLSWR